MNRLAPIIVDRVAVLIAGVTWSVMKGASH